MNMTQIASVLSLVCCLAADCSAWQYAATYRSQQGSVVRYDDPNPVRLLGFEAESSIQQTNFQVPPISSSAPFIRPPVVRDPIEIPQPDPRAVFDGPNAGNANPFLNAPADQPFFARLSRTPDLFGDSVIVFNSQFTTQPNTTTIDADLALGGGARRFKNEQAKAFPTDRAFIYYQHFHNALEFASNTGETADRSIDRVTIGFEKTFNNGQSSWELRMPFSGHQGITLNGFNYSSSGVGNLIISLKQLLYAEEGIAIALGLATSVPTGSNLTGSAGFANFRFENEAVHLLPYLGLQLAPNERWFFHAFVQVDTPVSDNTISTQPFGFPPAVSVDFRDETLMYLDAAVGFWWFQNDSLDALVRGQASMLEFHYTTSLEDAETATANNVFVGRRGNRINMLNMTVGLHTELADGWALRSAIVVPLRSGEDRSFDTEIQIALIKKLGRQ